MGLTRAGLNQPPGPETRARNLCDQQLVFWLPWTSLSAAPCTHHATLAGFPSQSKLSCAVTGGALATCPSAGPLCCCTQPSSAGPSPESPKANCTFRQPSAASKPLTPRLWPLFRSACAGTVLLCLLQLLAGVVGVTVTSPGSICPLI